MSSLERVDCIFQFFGESPQFAVIEEYTCYICIECSDFDCVADFSAVKNLHTWEMNALTILLIKETCERELLDARG